MGIALSQTQDRYAVASGTDTYAATFSPPVSVYETGKAYLVLFTNGNTGASTLDIDSLGATPLVKDGSTALASGDIAAGQVYECVFDGTNFQINVGGGGGGTPGGADTEVQFNDGGAFGGDAGFTFDKTTGLVNIGSLTASRGVLADASKNLISDGIGETRVAYNSTTQAVTSASETDITALVLSVAANKKYLVEIAIATECSGTSGIQFGHKFPSGSTFKLTHSGRTSGPTALMNLGNIYTSNTGLIANSVNTSASATGSYVASCLLVTTNSGNYQLTFASVSGVQTSTIREYGHIKLTEIP